ncbi:MAG: tannase/feruloyl esterase family alpha/beta hydrolase, partial [Actinomycetes bacterium]
MTAQGFLVRSKIFSALTALTVVVLGLGFAPSGAAAETTSGIRPVRQCAELVKDFDIPGAATHVTAATVVPAAAGEPEHCDVRGYVDPAVQFQ